MTCWATPFIGRKYAPTLADNCLGFARDVQREVFGRQLPGMLSLFRGSSAGVEIEDAFPEVEKPSDGCLVVMLDVNDRAAHVGVWCEAARRVVHAENVFGSVVADELGVVRFLWPSVRFFEVPA